MIKKSLVLTFSIYRDTCVTLFNWEYFDLFVKDKECVAKITGSNRFILPDEQFFEQLYVHIFTEGLVGSIEDKRNFPFPSLDNKFIFATVVYNMQVFIKNDRFIEQFLHR